MFIKVNSILSYTSRVFSYPSRQRRPLCIHVIWWSIYNFIIVNNFHHFKLTLWLRWWANRESVYGGHKSTEKQPYFWGVAPCWPLKEWRFEDWLRPDSYYSVWLKHVPECVLCIMTCMPSDGVIHLKRAAHSLYSISLQIKEVKQAKTSLWLQHFQQEEWRCSAVSRCGRLVA